MSDQSVTPMKRCNKCGEEYPATDKHFSRYRRDGNQLRAICKTCRNEQERIVTAGKQLTPEQKRIATERRFWSKVNKTPDGCWLWTAATTSGYGHFSVDGHLILTHRFSWEVAYGPILGDLLVLHDCPGGDNRRCVNPAHLWLGTQLENIADKVAKNRQSRTAQQGEKHPSTHLTDEDVRNIRRLYRTGDYTYAGLGEIYNLSYASIHDIVKRRTWRHIPD